MSPRSCYEYALDDVRETRGARGDAVAQLLRAGADISLLVPERRAARERDQDRRADDARVPGRAAFDSRAVAAGAGRGRLHRSAAMRRRAQRSALRRDLAVSVVDAAIRHAPAADRLGVFLKTARRPAQLPRAGQGARARTQGERKPQRERIAADLQDSDQFVLRLPRIFARAFQRLRRGQRGDEARTRPDPARGRRTGRTRRAGNRGRYRRNLFRAARRRR